MLQKLPDWVISGWNRYVTKQLRQTEEYPTFKEFAEFMAQEAEIACNPITSFHALKHTEEKPLKDKGRSKANAFNTTVKALDKSATETNRAADNHSNSSKKVNTFLSSPVTVKCIYCEESHSIHKYQMLTNKPAEEKKRLIFEQLVFWLSQKRTHGTALNDHLLTGPDLINGLTGVLCRFRKHPIVVICDVEKMFHRFHVRREDRDYLRTLWWENGNTNSEPIDCRMKVHLFGAASSPGCANYGMKYLASQHEEQYPLAANFIRKNFYVDDGLISLDSVDTAIKLVRETTVLKGDYTFTSSYSITEKF